MHRLFSDVFNQSNDYFTIPDDSAKNNLEINFSSRPDKYLLSLICLDYQEKIHKGACPVDNFLLMMKVYSPPGDNALIDFAEEIKLAEADIKRNMHVVFCEYENLQTVHLFGGTSKYSYVVLDILIEDV